MTKNQKSLIEFIADYRVKYGISPTLYEMVRGIGVSDHKSVSGIISSLVEDKFLDRGKQKTRAILLTDKAFEFLKIPLLRRQKLEKSSYSYPQMSSASSGMVVSSAHNHVGHGEQFIKANGTNLNNSFQNFIGNTLSGITTKIYENEETGIIFSWALLLGGLTWTNNVLIGNGTNALVWTAVEAIIIKFFSKKIIL